MAKPIYIKLPVIPVVQPLGIFYLCCMSSEKLLELTYPDVLTIEGVDKGKLGIYKLSGNQREEVLEKRKQIGRYIDSVEASFPNTIIIGANVDGNGYPINDMDLRWEVEEDKATNATFLIVPSPKRNARIIDGQHRLRGFDYSITGRRFDLPCAIYLDLPLSIQASIFATININQKKVDRSLAYELFGYNLDDEPTESWSPEKLAIFVTRKLNVDEESVLKGHIKVVARFSENVIELKDWTVATSVFVDGILSLFSSNPMMDREALNSVKLGERKRGDILKKDRSPLRDFYLENNDVFIYKLVSNFFHAANDLLFIKEDKGYITKTVGIQGLFDVLKVICPLAIQEKNISTKFFSSYLEKASHIDFEDKFFQASGIGRSRIRNIILLACNLNDILKIKEKDREAYSNLLKKNKSAIDENRWIWEDEAEKEIFRILESADWNFKNKSVSINSEYQNETEEIYTSYQQFRERLIGIAEATAINYMPWDSEEGGPQLNDSSIETIVDSSLSDFSSSILKMGWVIPS